MVRFRYRRPNASLGARAPPLFPYYLEQWIFYDPANLSSCTGPESWATVWERDKSEARESLHRKNSYYYSREFDEEVDQTGQGTPTLAILLFGSIIFCLFVPQIINFILSVFWPQEVRPPSPPPQPPTHSTGVKRLRLYHYAEPVIYKLPMGEKPLVIKTDNFYYNPENILNYVSETRIRALKMYNDEDEEDPSELHDPWDDEP